MAKRKPSERSHGAAHGEEEPLDLDVTPFLNILFMLILSILAMTSWTQLAMLNVSAPQIGGGNTGDGGGVAVPEEASQLNLTVLVRADGFNIAAVGATLDGNSEGRSGEPLIPLISRNGKPDYDYNALQLRLITIKKSYPEEESMIISADGDVPYDTIVKVMDAARKTADDKLLFPAVTFAAGVVG